ncbi:hypothetical protein, partial [Dysgonomonas sp. 511]|uniref:hypothetical protein n=1 Tax=Dysgonomonas sp. 511 TaxID=2302930 RepID=UPI001C86C546
TLLPQEWAMEFLTPYPGLYFYSFHNDDFVTYFIIAFSYSLVFFLLLRTFQGKIAWQQLSIGFL